MPCIRSGTRYKTSALADLRWPGVPADGPGWGAATCPARHPLGNSRGRRPGHEPHGAPQTTGARRRSVSRGCPQQATDEDNFGCPRLTASTRGHSAASARSAGGSRHYLPTVLPPTRPGLTPSLSPAAVYNAACSRGQAGSPPVRCPCNSVLPRPCTWPLMVLLISEFAGGSRLLADSQPLVLIRPSQACRLHGSHLGIPRRLRLLHRPGRIRRAVGPDRVLDRVLDRVNTRAYHRAL